MAATLVREGDPVPITLQIEDGNAGLFPQAVIRNSAGGLVATLDLTHVAAGLYTNTTLTMPAESWIVATYIVYTDAPHTIVSTIYLRDEDIFVQDSDYRVKASFAFNPASVTLDGNVWLERNGQFTAAVISLTANVYQSDGTLLFAMVDAAPDGQGIFRLSRVGPPGFVAGAALYMRFTLVAASGTYVGVEGYQMIA